MFAVGLFVCVMPNGASAEPSDARPQALQKLLDEGDCAAARTQARAWTSEAADEAAAWRWLGDAERCLGNSRPAIQAYRRYQELVGGDARVEVLIAGLTRMLSILQVSLGTEALPAQAQLILVVGEEHLEPIWDAPRLARFPDLPSGVVLRLELGGPGYRRESMDVGPLGPDSTEAVELGPVWLGFGRLRLSDAEIPGLKVRLALPNDERELSSEESLKVTADEVPLSVQTALGAVTATMRVEPRLEQRFDPGPWLPSVLRVAGLPAGASVRVFVEGPGGTSVSTERVIEPSGGVVDTATGVPVSAPVDFDSLLGGVGGVFVTHPVLGGGVLSVALAPGERNTATFDWSAMAGVPRMKAAYEGWRLKRSADLALSRTVPVVMGVVAGGTALTALALGLGALASEASAAETRLEAIAEIDSAASQDDIDYTRLGTLHDAQVLALQQGTDLLAGSVLLSGLSVTAAGLTIAFGLRSAGVRAGLVDWDPSGVSAQ